MKFESSCKCWDISLKNADMNLKGLGSAKVIWISHFEAMNICIKLCANTSSRCWCIILRINGDIFPVELTKNSGEILINLEEIIS